MTNSVWLGYDSREALGFAIARYSIRRFDSYVPIVGLTLQELQAIGSYTRPTETRINSEGRHQLWDVVSGAWMSTEHSCARFFIPLLDETSEWALFADCDVMFMRNVDELFRLCDPSKAVMCVQHVHEPEESVKMDGQVQSYYTRKNWSSVMAFNLKHAANKRLTYRMVNELPGRDLHRFCWLNDDEIGALPQEWNYLVGYTEKLDRPPGIVHFTRGLPDMPGWENQEYADEWRKLKTLAVGASSNGWIRRRSDSDWIGEGGLSFPPEAYSFWRR